MDQSGSRKSSTSMPCSRTSRGTSCLAGLAGGFEKWVAWTVNDDAQRGKGGVVMPRARHEHTSGASAQRGVVETRHSCRLTELCSLPMQIFTTGV